MKKSTRALVGLVVLDALIAAGAAWLVWQIETGATRTTVPPAEAITETTTLAGTIIGIVTAVLLFAFFHHRRNGN